MEIKIRENFLRAFITYIILTILLISIAVYFIFDSRFIGPIFLVLGILNLFILYLFGIKIISIYPDFVFGSIDNGILVFGAVIGGFYGGITGAVIGGAIGNTLTDGIGGLFEGYVAEKQRKEKIDNLRTAFSTSLGKMAGCLFGAGIAFIVVDIFKKAITFF